MNYYKKIPIWENRRRIDFLIKFRNLVVNYFNNVTYEQWGLGVVENEEAKKARTEINMSLHKAHFTTIAAGVNPSVFYTPPPAIGGITGDINVLLNIFHLHYYTINPQEALDIIDRAIGTYEDDRINSIIRIFNPFFWLDLLLDYIVSLPFKILGKFGLNQEKIEDSALGKIIKGILYLILVVAAFLEILDKLGFLASFNLWFYRVLGK
jgi:hypothetical protein